MVKTRKHRRMKGGFLGFDSQQSNPDWISTASQNVSNIWNNISQSASNMWEKTKQSVQNTKNNYFTSNNQSSNIFPSSNVGGKRTKKMRGGSYEAHSCYKSIASNAAPFWQPTAKPQVWVGGKSKKNRKQYKGKSRKNRH